MRAAAAAVGVVFGFMLAWTGVSDPDVIRRSLLLESPYMFELFFTAVAVAFAGNHLLRLVSRRVSWERLRPERRHVVGSVIFGAGWAISDACPGPIASQLGQGIGWSLFTIAGIGIGIALYGRRRADAPAPERRAVAVR
jgi:uncharacterized protein